MIKLTIIKYLKNKFDFTISRKTNRLFNEHSL